MGSPQKTAIQASSVGESALKRVNGLGGWANSTTRNRLATIAFVLLVAGPITTLVIWLAVKLARGR